MRKRNIFLSLIVVTLLPAISSGADTLRISEAIALALKSNFSITLAENENQIAGISNTPGAAGMLPRLDLTSSKTLTVNNTKQEYFNGTAKEANDAKTNNFNTGVQLTWTLFDGFNMFIQKSKLNELEDLSGLQLRSVIENMVAQVIQTYYGIVAQEALEKVYSEALRISVERMKFANARFNLGSGSELAVLQATVDMNADSANLIEQKAQIENLKAEMNYLLCRNLTERFYVSGTIPVSENLILEELLKNAAQSNPDLMIARNAISLSSLTIRELKSTQMPRLNFNSSFRYSKSSSDADLFRFSRNYGYTVGLSLSYNIFNGFTNRQKISAARIKSESASVTLKNTGLEIETNLRQVYNDYITYLKLAKFETNSLVFAFHNFDVAKEKYRLGTLNDVEFRETQAKLMEAENRLFSARYRCKLAETELLRLSGQLSGETGR